MVSGKSAACPLREPEQYPAVVAHGAALLNPFGWPFHAAPPTARMTALEGGSIRPRGFWPGLVLVWVVLGRSTDWSYREDWTTRVGLEPTTRAPPLHKYDVTHKIEGGNGLPRGLTWPIPADGDGTGRLVRCSILSGRADSVKLSRFCGGFCRNATRFGPRTCSRGPRARS